MPSGDQDGAKSATLLSVSLVWSAPSAFITYISRLPSRLLSKMILPLGNAVIEGIVGVGVGVAVGTGVGVGYGVGVGHGVYVGIGVGVWVG